VGWHAKANLKRNREEVVVQFVLQFATHRAYAQRRPADPPKPALSAAASLTKSPAHPKIKVSRTHVRLRVYAVNAACQDALAAMSWVRVLAPQATRTLGRGGRVIDMYKDAKKAWANRDKPAAKPPAEDDLRVRYTDLQGKEIWADWDVFLKATGFIEFEQAFYPHGHPMNKKPPIDWKGPAIQ
jgi:hypothetical protein